MTIKGFTSYKALHTDSMGPRPNVSNALLISEQRVALKMNCKESYESKLPMNNALWYLFPSLTNIIMVFQLKNNETLSIDNF